MGDVFRKIMGDVPLAFVETAGGIRVAEDDVVAVGKNDVLCFELLYSQYTDSQQVLSFKVGKA